jgi:transposase
MGRVNKYPDELRERAVRMVAEVRPQYPSQWAAICAVAGMLGIGTPETLRTWIRRSEVDTGQRLGVTTQMAEENKALRKEIAELRRANVILGRFDRSYNSGPYLARQTVSCSDLTAASTSHLQHAYGHHSARRNPHGLETHLWRRLPCDVGSRAPVRQHLRLSRRQRRRRILGRFGANRTLIGRPG